jgi:hypothetical protein
MTTLLEAYQNLDKSVWDYYDGFRQAGGIRNPFVSNPNAAAAHQQFIRKYFRLSGKEELLQQFGNLDMLYDTRAFHTDSVFFLGLVIRENTILKTHLLNAKKSKLNYPIFPFLWFLSVLFHDFAMRIEDNSDDYPMLSELDGLLAYYDIEHNILDKIPREADENLFGLIRQYYSYRHQDNKVDHGILAGIYLYDRLVKIRRQKSSQANAVLSWHHSLEKRYALAASAIACHNMWTIPAGHPITAAYTANGLEYLVQPQFNEISVQNFPLLFLFGIVDTIDPVKLYIQEHNVEDILKNIIVSFTKRTIRLVNAQASPLNFQRLVDKANGLGGWMAVEVDHGTDWLTISFKR